MNSGLTWPIPAHTNPGRSARTTLVGGVLTLPGGVTETLTPGGAACAGVAPAAAVAVGAGGLAAGGNAPAVFAPLSPGGGNAAGALAGVYVTFAPGGALAAAATAAAAAVPLSPGGAAAGGQLADPLAAAATVFFDAPSPTGGADAGSPAAGHFDAPTPAAVLA